MLAHEVGHESHHHLWKGLALFLGGTLAAFLAADLLLRVPQVFAAFGLGGPGAPGLLAVLALLAGPVSALVDPLFAALSRRHEYQADRASARALGRAAPLVEALIRLGRSNLGNPVPHPLYSAVRYSHPALPERIRALEELAL